MMLLKTSRHLICIQKPVPFTTELKLIIKLSQSSRNFPTSLFRTRTTQTDVSNSWFHQFCRWFSGSCLRFFSIRILISIFTCPAVSGQPSFFWATRCYRKRLRKASLASKIPPRSVRSVFLHSGVVTLHITPPLTYIQTFYAYFYC